MTTQQLDMTTVQRRRWLKEELTKAYISARLGKTKKPEVVEFDKVAKWHPQA